VRHRRQFSANDSAILLAAIGECRRACIAANSKAPIGDPIYRASTRLIEEIDLMAEALTGDRRHFWLKPSSTPGSKQPIGPHPDTYDWTWEQTKAERERERHNPSEAEEL
jgi:hypothetical protein